MHGLQSKKNKGQFLKEKEWKTEEKKNVFGGHKGPQAREPYGLPDQHGTPTTAVK
jgi:hypothetical protein